MNELDKRLMQTPDLNKERLAKLKEFFPDLFTIEGKLNPDELKKIIDLDSVKDTERFEFKWFGKSDSKRKAFTPSKAALFYDDNRSVDPDYADGNIIIEGENLETLKCLLSGYREKIKCIYIDPPYNTGNDFIYSDKWNEDKETYWEHIGVTLNGIKVDSNRETNGRYHSRWLNMMYSRLLLARQLLRDDGVIFISIDDNEVHHLRKICDEVFGEDNFVASIIWERSFSPVNLKKQFSESHDYLICFSKNIEMLKCNGLTRKLQTNNRYSNPDNDCRGDWTSSDMTVGPVIEEKVYEIETPSGKKIKPTNGRCWLYSKDRFQEMLEDNRIWFGKNGDNVPRVKKFLSEVKEGVTPMTLWKYSDVGHSQEAAQLLKKLFNGKDYFDYPKPVGLIKRTIELYSNENDLILDFFSGSGTTAQAVMELNKEDGGNRKFILVQLPELTNEKSEAYKAGYKKISDITIQRCKRVIEKIEKEEKEKQPQLLEENKKPFKTGFKVYRLAKSNFPRVDFAPDPEKTEEENIKLLDKYIAEKERAFNIPLHNEKEIFDEVLLKNGFTLNYNLKELKKFFSKNKVYLAKDEFKECLICIDTGINNETLKQIEKYKEKIFICLERSLDTTKKWNLKHLLGDKLIAF
jgi:adenine-specific DNA-methyltransferase